MEYEDKGLSGDYSDHLDFQRMLHDVQDGNIRAIVCYKLDRIGRKTTDLLRLMDFLEKYNVDLLICSNGINTASGVSKIFIQIFAVVAEFNASTTRLVLRNPIYCTADKRSYDYFIDHEGNVFGDLADFDGQHGLSAYNKTDQEKYEDSDSTFIFSKFVQTTENKPISEWIIAVGRHEGFISSERWIETQELLDAIAEKYNRPHRKTNALLAGIVHCPCCGKQLSVIPESNRWTNGKPCFNMSALDSGKRPVISKR